MKLRFRFLSSFVVTFVVNIGQKTITFWISFSSFFLKDGIKKWKANKNQSEIFGHSWIEPKYNELWTLQKARTSNLFGQKWIKPRPKSGKTELWTLPNPCSSTQIEPWTHPNPPKIQNIYFFLYQTLSFNNSFKIYISTRECRIYHNIFYFKIWVINTGCPILMGWIS